MVKAAKEARDPTWVKTLIQILPLAVWAPASIEAFVDTAKKGMEKVPTWNKPGSLDSGAGSVQAREPQCGRTCAELILISE